MSNVADDEVSRRLSALLGLAQRARKLAVGLTAVERLVGRAARPLIIVARDAGGSTQRRLRNLEPARGRLWAPLTREELGRICGREELAVVAVGDPGFVRGVLALGLERCEPLEN